MKRRKLKNKIKKMTALAMLVMAFVSIMLYAFHRPYLVYEVLFFVGIGWTLIFLKVNGGGRHER